MEGRSKRRRVMWKLCPNCESRPDEATARKNGWTEPTDHLCERCNLCRDVCCECRGVCERCEEPLHPRDMCRQHRDCGMCEVCCKKAYTCLECKKDTRDDGEDEGVCRKCRKCPHHCVHGLAEAGLQQLPPQVHQQQLAAAILRQQQQAHPQQQQHTRPHSQVQQQAQVAAAAAATAAAAAPALLAAQQGYASQVQQGYSHQAQQGYAHQAQQGYANQAQQGYSNQTQQGYSNQTQQGYANQAQQGYSNQTQQGYGNPLLNPLLQQLAHPGAAQMLSLLNPSVYNAAISHAASQVPASAHQLRGAPAQGQQYGGMHASHHSMPPAS